MTGTAPTVTVYRSGGCRAGHRRPRRASGLAIFAVLAAAVTGVAGWAAPAAAQGLDQLRASGLVCERPDGLLHARSGGGSVQQQVDAINQKRLAAYEAVARDTGTTVEQVRIVSGEKLRAKYGGCP